MRGLVVDENLERLTVLTGGLERQEYWLAQLTEKYGEPTHLDSEKKENRLGAVFNSYVVSWRFSNLGVDFQGSLDSTEMGSIDVVTNKGIDFLSGTRLDHPPQKQNQGPKL